MTRATHMCKALLAPVSIPAGRAEAKPGVHGRAAPPSAGNWEPPCGHELFLHATLLDTWRAPLCFSLPHLTPQTKAHTSPDRAPQKKDGATKSQRTNPKPKSRRIQHRHAEPTIIDHAHAHLERPHHAHQSPSPAAALTVSDHAHLDNTCPNLRVNHLARPHHAPPTNGKAEDLGEAHKGLEERHVPEGFATSLAMLLNTCAHTHTHACCDSFAGISRGPPTSPAQHPGLRRGRRARSSTNVGGRGEAWRDSALYFTSRRSGSYAEAYGGAQQSPTWPK